MNNRVTLLHRDNPGDVVSNLTKIVEFMGGTVQSVALRGEAVRQEEILRSLVLEGGCVIADSEVVSPELRSALLDLRAQVLVYGFDASSRSGALMKALAAGAVERIETRQSARISVAQYREACGPMAGQSFEVRGATVSFTFSGGHFTPLLFAGADPFFVSVSAPGGRWMLLAGDGIANLDAPVARGDSMLNFFPGLAPVMIFLRSSAPGDFWQNETPTACFIVDDPLLRPRYGFLDFAKLFGLMDDRRFSTNVAFIPWNYRRSAREVVSQFVRRPGACSLSVHGCDHTRGEFASEDGPLLARKAQLALDRMERHRTLTGLGFDDVMVFPQGLFSRAALTALKSCSYLAAVNSTPYPVDGEQSLPLRELLGIAVTRFAEFPLFTRRYPGHIGELAFDLFLGKPAFLVEHHGFFQDGYEALAAAVEEVGSLDPRLTWTNLADACSRACMERTGGQDEVHVQFATSRFILENRSDRRRHFVLTRQGCPVRGATAVLPGGCRLEIEAGAAHQVRLALAAGQTAKILVEQELAEEKAPSSRTGLLYPLRVYLRRNLSEFRDNHIETSRIFGRRPEAAK